MFRQGEKRNCPYVIILKMDASKNDKFKALWLSHSKINDFLKCPRLYYLHNIYKDLKTNHKITIITPPLTLGQVIHETIDTLATLPLEERFLIPLNDRFEKVWQKITGQKGGFENNDEEDAYKERGLKIIKRIEEDPGPIARKAIRLKSDKGLLYYWFSKERNIILSGKIDWIEYLPDSDMVHIIDFKTGILEEDEGSMQLPIYLLLAKNLQQRKVHKMSYWYLNNEKNIVEKKLPNEQDAVEKVSKIADRILLAKKLNHFKCPTEVCKYCYPYEQILKGHGKWVGISEYDQDIYFLKKPRPEINL